MIPKSKLIHLPPDILHTWLMDRTHNTNLVLPTFEHDYLANIAGAGYPHTFHILKVPTLDSLKQILSANNDCKGTPFYINYILDLGLRTFPDYDVGSDDLLNLTKELKDTPGFEQLKWRFSNGWDAYGHREQQRSKWFLKQIEHIAQHNIIMDVTNFDIVDFYKTLLPNADINYYTAFDIRWLSDNLYSEPYINDNENKTKHLLCLNRLWKPHRTQIWHYIIEQDLMEKFHYSYTTAGVYLNSDEEAEISAEVNDTGYTKALTIQERVPRGIINDCYAYVCTETFFYKYEVESPNIWYDHEAPVTIIDPPDEWLMDTMFDHSYITEKSYKSAYCELPMLVAGLPNSLKTWRRLGFESFPEFFDESYDLEYDDEKRMQMVQHEIEKFCNTDINDIHNLYYSDAVQQKLKRNKQNFYKKIRESLSTNAASIKFQKGINPAVDEVFNSEF